MFYIIESESQINHLSNLGRKGGYVEVISSNDYYHPKLTYTVGVYIRPLDHPEGYILPVNHSEGLNLEKIRVQEVLKSFTTLYTFNKKNFLYHFSHSNIQDINLMYSLQEYKPLDLPNQPTTLQWYYNKLQSNKDINSILPITKLFERCERNYRSLEEVIEKYQHSTEDPSWRFYNNIYTGVFFLSEQSGVRVVYDKFVEKFTPRSPVYSIDNNKVYTNYNLYNPTSRPTNSFNSVNFTAIPKKEEYRKCFIPSNSSLIEFDFDGYHLRLIGEQVGYEFSSESIHLQLGRMYFGKEELTEEEYKQSKQTTFQIMYGGIPSKYKHIEFFQKVSIFIDNLWKEYEESGIVRDPISKKPFSKKLEDMNPQKLFNYIIQSLETSRNILILKEVLRYLQNKKTKVILYIYDAIIFDYSEEDGEETLKDLQEILDSQGRYPVKYKVSNNLSF